VNYSNSQRAGVILYLTALLFGGYLTSSIPNIKANPNYVNLAKKIRRTYRGNLKIVERQFQEKDTELDKI